MLASAILTSPLLAWLLVRTVTAIRRSRARRRNLRKLARVLDKRWSA
jgi:hypothetical protein